MYRRFLPSKLNTSSSKEGKLFCLEYCPVRRVYSLDRTCPRATQQGISVSATAHFLERKAAWVFPTKRKRAPRPPGGLRKDQHPDPRALAPLGRKTRRLCRRDGGRASEPQENSSGHSLAPASRPPSPGRTCVSAQMSLEMGTFEVGLPAAWEVANVVPPSRKVYLRGTVLAGGDKHWGGRERQQLGAPDSHNAGRAGGRLGQGARGQDQHHSSLRHRRAHEHGLGRGSRLG